MKGRFVSKMPNENQREIKSFQEAIIEAKRCLQCPKPMCRTGCPVENDIPSFIFALSKGNIGEAIEIIQRRSNLPAICGRICPHEEQCEAKCILAKKGEAIRIGELERFVADIANEMELDSYEREERKGKIAVVGSGPAGITVAQDLAKAGFAVTVFESQSELGGVLTYGIPEFRLPKEMVRRETRKLEKLGVEIQTNVTIGEPFSMDDLLANGYDAVFLGTGSSAPTYLNIPGQELKGIFSAMDFLSGVELLAQGRCKDEEVAVQPGDSVIVVGGGNVAIDAARAAIRRGAKNVTVVYRRTIEEMPALLSEYEHAVAEGVVFSWLTNPVAYLGNESLERVQVCQMVLNEDRKPVATDEVWELEADKILLAVGQSPNDQSFVDDQDIQRDPCGYLIVQDEPYGMTSKRGVFACGDVVHGPATVVLAMKEGKKVAKGIADYIHAVQLLEKLEK